jgi:hypothetical protein
VGGRDGTKLISGDLIEQARKRGGREINDSLESLYMSVGVMKD